MKPIALALFAFSSTGFIISALSSCKTEEVTKKRPNILIAISDDQSYIHAGPYRQVYVRTPAMNELAEEGILFNNAFVASPMCTVSRASLLTGRNPWQNGEAGQHNSLFPSKLSTYPDLLEQAGYQTGFTGKGWAPGNWEIDGRSFNPAGHEYNTELIAEKPALDMSKYDYAANFRKFLKEKPEDKPFCFWYGAQEPHDPWEPGSGLRAGYSLDSLVLPPNFSSQSEHSRTRHLDYLLEIEWFDIQLGEIIKILKESGEYENTLIVVTSDNGSPMPGAKCNLYDFGIHVPMVILWPEKVKPGQISDELISQIDLAPTFLEIAGLSKPDGMTGRSFLGLLLENNSRKYNPRKYIFAAQEKSSHQRKDNLGYPMRCVRSEEFLYIRNFKPERWPDGEAPDPGRLKRYNHWSLQRPSEELYNVVNDPACLVNLAERPEYNAIRIDLQKILYDTLWAQQDPRVMGFGDIFESFPRYGTYNPEIEGFNKRGEYNPTYMIEIPSSIFVSDTYHKNLKKMK
jgi:uncharacterized sulfatase